MRTLWAGIGAQACPAGHVSGGLPVGYAGLGQYVADVVAYGLVGQVKPGGDGTVGQAAGEQLEYLDLSPGELGNAREVGVFPCGG